MLSPGHQYPPDPIHLVLLTWLVDDNGVLQRLDGITGRSDGVVGEEEEELRGRSRSQKTRHGIGR